MTWELKLFIKCLFHKMSFLCAYHPHDFDANHFTWYMYFVNIFFYLTLFFRSNICNVMPKLPVQKTNTQNNTKTKHLEHQDATDIQNKLLFVFLDFFSYFRFQKWFLQEMLSYQQVIYTFFLICLAAKPFAKKCIFILINYLRTNWEIKSVILHFK